jgi:hypothetical protein
MVFLQKQVRGVSVGRAVKMVKLVARKSHTRPSSDKAISWRHFWGRPEKLEHARDGIGEVAPISAHRFRLLKPHRSGWKAF